VIKHSHFIKADYLSAIYSIDQHLFVIDSWKHITKRILASRGGRGPWFKHEQMITSWTWSSWTTSFDHAWALLIHKTISVLLYDWYNISISSHYLPVIDISMMIAFLCFWQWSSYSACLYCFDSERNETK
jgi:hypothetical protein